VCSLTFAAELSVHALRPPAARPVSRGGGDGKGGCDDPGTAAVWQALGFAPDGLSYVG
jgi:hypothetical protein